MRESAFERLSHLIISDKREREGGRERRKEKQRERERSQRKNCPGQVKKLAKDGQNQKNLVPYQHLH